MSNRCVTMDTNEWAHIPVTLAAAWSTCNDDPTV